MRRLLRWVFRVSQTQMIRTGYSGSWFFLDFYGQIWKLKETGDTSMPLIITLEYR